MEKVRLHSIDEGTYVVGVTKLFYVVRIIFHSMYIPIYDPADLYNIKVKITSKEYPYNLIKLTLVKSVVRIMVMQYWNTIGKY